MTLSEMLTTQDCYRLLAGSSLGRIAYTERALPVIRPVPYVLVGTHLVLRPDLDGLAARLDGQIVAFEIDDGAQDRVFEWSVVVTGVASALGDTGQLTQPAALTCTSWFGRGQAAAVQIIPGAVVGRRVRPDGAAVR